MLKIGITGGIGSGKTTICKLFSILGVPVFQADKEARKIMNIDFNVQKKITRLFGEDVYLQDRSLDRSMLASIVFKSPSLLEKLNEIIHPAVRDAFMRWCKNQEADYVIHEAAILFESGFHHFMDKNIAVIADEQIRIHRVMKRDRITDIEVKERIKNQWDDGRRIELSDWIITNNDKVLVVPQILQIDKKIRAYGQI